MSSMMHQLQHYFGLWNGDMECIETNSPENPNTNSIVCGYTCRYCGIFESSKVINFEIIDKKDNRKNTPCVEPSKNLIGY